MRHRPGLSSLQQALRAGRHGLRLSRLRQGPGRGLRLRARRAPLPRGAERGAPAQHLALRGAAADRRRLRAGARGSTLRLHPTDPRRSPGRRARALQPVPQGRLHLAAEPLLQGPRGLHVGRPPAGAGQGRDRLRLHRQRRHRRRLARGQGGAGRLRLLPQPSREHQGAGVHGAGRQGLPGGGQLRRSQPALSRARRKHGHGLRQHHAATVLRGGRQDGGVRDRRAARLAGSRPHRHRSRRRHALLAPAQGAARAGAARPL